MADLIAGKSFCFTGILSDMKRTEVEALVRERGGSFVLTVTPWTDYLVKGIRPGNTKVKAAEEYNIRQISESEFHRMLNMPLVLGNDGYLRRQSVDLADDSVDAVRWWISAQQTAQREREVRYPNINAHLGNNSLENPTSPKAAEPKPTSTKRRFAIGRPKTEE